MLDLKNEKIINLELFETQNPEMFYTYGHYRKSDDVIFYIGKGKLDRCLHHVDRNDWWKNVVAKHGYYIKILDVNLTEGSAHSKEVEYIKLYGRKQFKNGGTLINLTDGGEGVSGKIWSDDERKQKSDKYKTNPSYWQSGNRKDYFGKQMYGEENPNYGNTGDKNPLSRPIVKLSLTGDLIGHYASATEYSKIDSTVSANGVSAVASGRRNQLKGFKYVYLEDYISGNYSIVLGSTNRTPIYQLNMNNEIVKRYEATADAKIDGFNPTNISQVCGGKKKSHLGYKWIKVSDYKEDIV